MEKERLKEVQGWILDMDGVLYRDTQPIAGAKELLEFLQEHRIPFLLLTNNSTLTPEQYESKLAGMGIRVPASRILTSSLATAAYLKERLPAGAQLYVIGEDGLRQALRQAGFRIMASRDGCTAVVVGLDRSLTFAQLKEAALAIRAGAAFIATNADRTLPTPEGEIPGNGAILAALEVATGISPVVVGKPEPRILLWAVQQLGLPAQAVACVGDRLETDVVGGRRAGLLTVLLLCGVTTAEHLASASVAPDFVFPDPQALLGAIASARARS